MLDSDRRRSERRPIRLALLISGMNADGRGFHEVTTSINISSQGAYFPLSRPVGEDSELEVAIVPPEHVRGSLDVRFRVRSRVVRRDPGVSPDAPTHLAIQFTETFRIG